MSGPQIMIILDKISVKEIYFRFELGSVLIILFQKFIFIISFEQVIIKKKKLKIKRITFENE